MEGQPGLVGSTVAIYYSDQSCWCVRITEISDKYNRICFDLIKAEPATNVSSIETEIQLHSCSYDNNTCVIWSTEFSNDCDANTIQDSKYKKHDFFNDMKSHMAPKK